MMTKSLTIGIALIFVLLPGCRAIENDVSNYLRSASIKHLDLERGQTRFGRLGQKTLRLVCRRVNEQQGVCHLMPNSGKFTSCESFVLTTKPSADIMNFLKGELNSVRSSGMLPARSCFKR